jgi:hypothetical protein
MHFFHLFVFLNFLKNIKYYSCNDWPLNTWKTIKQYFHNNNPHTCESVIELNSIFFFIKTIDLLDLWPKTNFFVHLQLIGVVLSNCVKKKVSPAWSSYGHLYHQEIYLLRLWKNFWNIMLALNVYIFGCFVDNVISVIVASV